MFQFRNGSIKRSVAVTADTMTLGFNSEMVRLKGLRLSNVIGRGTKFQFRNGSIKRTKIIIYAREGNLFQFRNGSIKSLSASSASSKVLSFNSEMVRLKVF